jgi:hypothetical protein
MDLLFTIATEPCQCNHLRSESRGTHDVFMSQIRNSSNLDGQVPVFTSRRNRVAQALGSIFVASYDSQGYGGGIRPRLPAVSLNPTRYMGTSGRNARNIHTQQYKSYVFCCRVATGSRQLLGKNVPAERIRMQQSKYCWKRGFFVGPCQDVITEIIWATK